MHFTHKLENQLSKGHDILHAAGVSTVDDLNKVL